MIMRILRSRSLGRFAVSSVACVVLLLSARAAFEPGAILQPGASLEIEAAGQGAGTERLRLTGRVFFLGPRGGGPLPAGARPVASLEIFDGVDGRTIVAQYFGDSNF